MSTHDLIVIGGGPAGANAAIMAAKVGLEVLLVDENDAAGGQVWRAPSTALGEAPAGHEAGALLRARLAASGVACRFGRRVWLVEQGFTVRSLGPGGEEQARAPALIAATGAVERHLPVPGWTLPGVMGLAAATVLLKSARVLPGERVVVAGAGPLLALVANAIIAGGGRVAAVIDANRARVWLANGRGLVARPDLLARGAGWIARLRAAGVPWLSARMVRSIEGKETAAGVRVGPVNKDWTPVPGAERRFECDAVCMGFGLMPGSDVLRLLGADFVWNPHLGGWGPVTDKDQATRIKGLYVCGDAAGVLGAAAAPIGGMIAALAAAHDLGRIERAEFERRAAALRAKFNRASRFGQALATLTAPRMGAAAAIAAEAEVCRCEGLTRAALEHAIADGAVTVNDLKAATRCGMGPCGGRICGDVAELLIAAATGRERAEIQPATPRPPLRPVAIGVLAGTFDYASLPMAEPAPL
ncbi:MAG: NAD(P)/FAD-dependent oxidoreductase [Acetobacteraceae bacterium]